MKKILSLMLFLTASASLSATTISFSAQVANNLAGIAGADLATTDNISVGTWDGASSTFTSLDSGSNDNVDFGPGFFSHSFGPTPSTAGAQLAFSWSTAGSETAIIYYDISAGDATAANWTLKGGDGSGTDFNVNAIDVSNLTTEDSGYTILSSSAVLINATFSSSITNTAAGVPSFNLVAVPEPSSYALLGGLLALGCVMLRRRA